MNPQTTPPNPVQKAPPRPAMERKAAARAALLAPEKVTIGGFTVRRLTGGDLLIGDDIGLVLAGGDVEKIHAMEFRDKKRELLTLGALLCHPVEALTAALWSMPKDEILKTYVTPVVMKLTISEHVELIDHVGRFIALAAGLAVDVEEKPTDTSSGPSPSGK